MNSFHELLTFRSYRTLTGHAEPVDVYRRNGRPAVHFLEPLPLGKEVSHRLWATLSDNLTRIECQTWWKLLGGRPIAAIAEEEGVSRTAIYVRIRGKKGKGGMVRKNQWVARWWDRRQQQRHDQSS